MRLKRRNYVLIWAGGTAASMALEKALASVLTPVTAPQPFADDLERSLKAAVDRGATSPWRSLGIVGGVATAIAGLTAFLLWLSRQRKEALRAA